jgi:succinate dehydrogenase / fumarate reductase iron-sulfur subunit
MLAMEKKIKILRQKSKDTAPYWQTFSYCFDNKNETVANALIQLNEREPLCDIAGAPTDEISWQCSCLQKKCGACAMRINGVPKLACDTKLADCKGDIIQLEPLKKFPLVKDLIVDRTVLFENLKQLKVWFEDETKADSKKIEDVQDASRCLQCGCCLEVCPNFIPEGKFKGMAAGVQLSRLIMELPASQKKEVYRSYRKYIYAGCGKSLSCHNICPAGIDTEHLMVKSNAAAVWRKQI